MKSGVISFEEPHRQKSNRDKKTSEQKFTAVQVNYGDTFCSFAVVASNLKLLNEALVSKFNC